MDGYRIDRTLLTASDMQAILTGLRSLDSVSGNRKNETADGKIVRRESGHTHFQ